MFRDLSLAQWALLLTLSYLQVGLFATACFLLTVRAPRTPYALRTLLAAVAYWPALLWRWGRSGGGVVHRLLSLHSAVVRGEVQERSAAVAVTAAPLVAPGGGTLADVGKAFLVCEACDHCVSKFGIYRDGDPCPSCNRTLEVSND